MQRKEAEIKRYAERIKRRSITRKQKRKGKKLGNAVKLELNKDI